jgi:hypothetical protein
MCSTFGVECGEWLRALTRGACLEQHDDVTSRALSFFALRVCDKASSGCTLRSHSAFASQKDSP